ncbi:hypothetical protein EDEG_02523 [Edhazardia aedis USNM 41457]|uniref:Uncharacterized protein n=1 Tax=Edhazardia aedis (strain USNM 41457) TaxID=1003232 RepID=J9D5Q3_EDHAE|nr:hypothetical protein EDEG_02523 [Edhazardia aedis USNM 41457]|eukprot:EJW03096.1 hypothetical protein EDEG_02523 [Edhazardia aedis USNM 41457]
MRMNTKTIQTDIKTFFNEQITRSSIKKIRKATHKNIKNKNAFYCEIQRNQEKIVEALLCLNHVDTQKEFLSLLYTNIKITDIFPDNSILSIISNFCSKNFNLDSLNFLLNINHTRNDMFGVRVLKVLTKEDDLFISQRIVLISSYNAEKEVSKADELLLNDFNKDETFLNDNKEYSDYSGIKCLAVKNNGNFDKNTNNNFNINLENKKINNIPNCNFLFFCDNEMKLVCKKIYYIKYINVDFFVTDMDFLYLKIGKISFKIKIWGSSSVKIFDLLISKECKGIFQNKKTSIKNFESKIDIIDNNQQAKIPIENMTNKENSTILNQYDPIIAENIDKIDSNDKLRSILIPYDTQNVVDSQYLIDTQNMVDVQSTFPTDIIEASKKNTVDKKKSSWQTDITSEIKNALDLKEKCEGDNIWKKTKNRNINISNTKTNEKIKNAKKQQKNKRLIPPRNFINTSESFESSKSTKSLQKDLNKKVVNKNTEMDNFLTPETSSTKINKNNKPLSQKNKQVLLSLSRSMEKNIEQNILKNYCDKNNTNNIRKSSVGSSIFNTELSDKLYCKNNSSKNTIIGKINDDKNDNTKNKVDYKIFDNKNSDTKNIIDYKIIDNKNKMKNKLFENKNKIETSCDNDFLENFCYIKKKVNIRKRKMAIQKRER